MTHRHLLLGICFDKDIERQLLYRSINFIRSTFTSDNSLFKCSGNLAVRGSSSSVSNTIARLSNELSVDRQVLVNSGNLLFRGPVCERTGAIREFAIARHSASSEDREIIDDILRHLGIG